MVRALIVAVAVVAGAFPGGVRGEDDAGYLRHVKPVLQARCYSCHGSLKQEGGLRVDTAEFLLKGGDSGPAVVAGQPGESLLLDMVAVTDGKALMPGEGAPLKPEEIEHLRAWIAGGAPKPETEAAARDPRTHWAYQRPSKGPLPEVGEAAWLANPIDRFVRAKQIERGLTASETARPEILLRRVSLDLIGLPPTRGELDAFLADPSEEHYARVVDRLLSSPRYGERWGRHWMDVWRYSDWDGYQQEVRESQPHIWRWRDWIIESLNDDKPYDRMLVEMLAGDEVSPEDPQTLRATGYLARNWFKFNRHVWLDNTVEHTGKAFLGLTFNCARCHDHMYDPFPQQNYYQLRAFFEPHDVRTDRVPGEPDTGKSGLVRVYDAHLDRGTFLFARGDEKRPEETPLTPAIPEFFAASTPAIEAVALAPRAWYPGLQEFVQEELLTAARGERDARRVELDAARRKEAEFRSVQRQELEAPLTAVRNRLLDRFRARRDDLWTMGSGEWSYAEGGLRQGAVGNERRELAARMEHPRDFRLRLRFQTTGGTQWKSVGMSFDADEGGDHSVYVSAYAQGSKVQIAHRDGEQTAYPAEGARALPVELGRTYELEVRVRDGLVNVSVDGVLQIAYTLPAERRSQRGLRLWTFDAQAEFASIQVDDLSPQMVLATSVAEGAAGVAGAEALERELRLAELALSTAEAKLAFIEARSAADRARYLEENSSESAALIAAAAKGEWEWNRLAAELALLQAEKSEAEAAALPETEKMRPQKIEQAQANVKKQREALEQLQQATEPPADYTRVGSTYPQTSSGRRLALAQWIADEENPLTARVAVNHIWLRHFGRPLVESVFDFGMNGTTPTHPELLDWLAVELMERGWSTKHLHRLIVTSRTYRQGSQISEATRGSAEADSSNALLWRMNLKRMEAEIVRDGTLHAAGSLDETMFGPDLDPDKGEQVARRSIYFRSSKEKRMTYLDVFDRANVVACYRRDETVVPQQALAQANSALTIEQSRKLAAALWDETATAEDRPAEFVRQGFRQILSREATPDELALCGKFLAEQAELLSDPASLTPFAAAGKNAAIPASSDPAQRARENLIHVLFNHNDFVTIR